jgi:hypothetical protein
MSLNLPNCHHCGKLKDAPALDGLVKVSVAKPNVLEETHFHVIDFCSWKCCWEFVSQFASNQAAAK